MYYLEYRRERILCVCGNGVLCREQLITLIAVVEKTLPPYRLVVVVVVLAKERDRVGM